MSDAPRTEGERWIREELLALRDAHFAPVALARFLWRSQVRANAVRSARPELARREVQLLGLGAVAYLPAVATGATTARSALRWWVLTGLMLDWHLGMVESEDGRPRNLAVADALTLGRAWLVPLALTRPTPAVVLVGWGSDVADGIAARAGAGPTRAGRDLEGLVDVGFGTAVLVGARRAGLLGRGVVIVETARVTAGVAYAVLAYFARATPPDRAMLRAGRATTVARAAGTLLATRGRRAQGEALLGAGSAVSLALLCRAATR